MGNIYPTAVPFSACGVLLAGGRSARMGRNKALIELEGEPLIAHLARRFRQWFAQVVVVTNTPDEYAFVDLPMVADAVPGLGPLGGLEAGLSASQHEAAFVAACDLPFMQRDVIAYMLDLLAGHDAVVPMLGGEYEPTHAVYARRCLPAVRAGLQAGRRRMVSFFDQVRVRRVEAAELEPWIAPELLFFNCNTPADVERLYQLWPAHRGGR